MRRKKIGILITIVSNFGKIGSYNSQEVGMGKAFVRLGYDVIIYKLEEKGTDTGIKTIELQDHLQLVLIPAQFKLGINGFLNTSLLDSSIVALIFFSDIQLAMPSIGRWCKSHDVLFMPYVGVITSHSDRKAVSCISNWLFYRNLRWYKKTVAYCKTPTIQQQMKKKGINNSKLAPVGIDMQIMYENSEALDRKKLREDFDCAVNSKIMLFVGRLEIEKNPLGMIDVFEKVHKADDSWRLVIVGKGTLASAINEKIVRLGLTAYIRIVESVPNSEMWKYYRMVDVFVNLNKDEIFGMAILEAMFYKCPVIAMRAPGPEYIINSGVDGILVDDTNELVDSFDRISMIDTEAGRQKIKNNFNWESTAEVFSNDIVSMESES